MEAYCLIDVEVQGSLNGLDDVVVISSLSCFYKVARWAILYQVIHSKAATYSCNSSMGSNTGGMAVFTSILQACKRPLPITAHAASCRHDQAPGDSAAAAMLQDVQHTTAAAMLQDCRADMQSMQL